MIRVAGAGVLAWAAALALAAMLVPGVGPGPAHAQGEVRESFGDWQLRCDTPPGARSEQCALVQSVTAEDRENVGLTVIVLETADGEDRILRVLAPLGVLLSVDLGEDEIGGLGLNIDGDFIGRVRFVRCMPNGCLAEVSMDDELVSLLGEGEEAIFVIYQTPEEGIGIPLSLAGFEEGYEALLPGAE